MYKNSLKIIIISAIITSSFLFPANSHAAFDITSNIQAGIYMAPDFDLFLDPEYLYINITADSGINAINATGINMQYNPAKMQIAEIDYSLSFCMEFINETVDNASGTFNLNCGTPLAVSSSTLPVARIKFLKIDSGWTNLALSDSHLLANDGLGSEIPVDNEIHSIYIIKN
jgi:hypothetical protein